jgi:hypothetical protein
MHGPCGPELHFCPTYSLPIRVVDDVVATLLGTRRRTKWRRERAKGLGLWNPAGVEFYVEEGPGASYSYYDPAAPKDVYLTPLVIPDAIRLVRNKLPLGAYRYRSAFATYIGGGVAVFAPKHETLPLYAWHRTICHEVGHCLGLEHGSNGVMMGGLVPNDHDLDSVRRYYL